MSLGIKLLIGTLIVGGLAMVGAAGYFGFASNQPSEPDVIEAPPTVTVTRDNVDLTVTAPGSLVASGKQSVRSEIEGQLASITVQAGEMVRAGDVIATLETASLEEALLKAQQAIADAEDAIASGISGAQNAVIDAQARLTELQLQYPTKERSQLGLDQARAGLADAQAALGRANTQLANAQSKRDSKQSGSNTANTELADAKSKRDTAKQTLTDAQTAQTTAQTNYDKAVANQATAQQAYDAAVANAASQTEIDQRQLELNTAIAATADAQTKLNTAKSTTLTAQTKFDEAEAAYQKEVAEQVQAQTESEQAQSAYEQAVIGVEQAQAGVRNAEFGVRQAELDLRDVEKQQKIADQQIAAAQRALETAQGNLSYAQNCTVDAELLEAIEDAKAAIDAAVIRAPIDGQVQDVHHSAQEFIQKGEAIVTLTNPELLEVYSTVIEEDLPLVQVGSSVNLFFDAAPDADVTGRVDRIVPERVSGADRPLYAVYITIDGAVPQGLVAGMSAEGSIIVDQRVDVLTLPRAVVHARSDGTAEVEVWNGVSEETRIITIGLRGDVYVEILDGLAEGDQVVAD